MVSVTNFSEIHFYDSLQQLRLIKAYQNNQFYKLFIDGKHKRLYFFITSTISQNND